MKTYPDILVKYILGHLPFLFKGFFLYFLQSNFNTCVNKRKYRIVNILKVLQTLQAKPILKKKLKAELTRKKKSTQTKPERTNNTITAILLFVFSIFLILFLENTDKSQCLISHRQVLEIVERTKA